MKNIKIKLIVLFFLCFRSYYSEAYTQNNQFSFNRTPCGVEFKLNLKKKEKIYWKTPGALGFPTKIDLAASENIKDFNIKWPIPQETGVTLKDIYYYYSGDINIPIDIEAKDSSQPIKFKAELSYAICGKKCIPVKQVIEETFTIDSCNIHREPSFVVEALSFDKITSKLVALINLKEDSAENPNFVFEPIGDIYFRAPKLIKRDGNLITIETPLAEKEVNRLQDSTINVYSNISDLPYVYDKGIIITNVKPVNYNILLIIALAMLGGFILNFMPCVFPILSLKVFSILKTVSYKPHKTKAALIISSLGIITTFIALGMLVNILKALGHEVFFGQNFQEPIFITFLCLSLLIFISSSQDRLNLKFPNIIVNKTTNIKFDNYYFEAFSSGVIASLLSTPCTAPFLGTAVSLALSGDAILVYLIFTSIGLGFALPYLLLAFSPSLLARLPKPGKWMDKIKKFLTLLLIGTLLWLLYIYCTQRGIYNSLGLAGLLLLIKFVIELRKGFIANKVPKLVIFCLLSFLLFYLPQFSYTREVILHRNTAKTWQNIDLQEIPRLIDEGKIVVVDVTADWCVTCKFNKLTVLNLQKTLDLLSDKNIIAIRADFTNYSSDILFFLKTHEVHGVPFNIVYSKAAPAGIILPTLLNYKDLIEAIEKARVK